MKLSFDVIVVGGGHAGVEAARAAAKMGSSTLLLTLDPEKVATMPCNPSIGGLGKGHLVFEVSALGGLMPTLCTETYLQARMLNTRKGPAVQGLRLQIDKFAYTKAAFTHLATVPNLTIMQGTGSELLVAQEPNQKTRVIGVSTLDGKKLYAPTVVVTCGTFLNGIVHVGLTRYKAGRRGEDAVDGFSQSIGKAMGVQIGRLKTGTPPRLRTSSINFDALERQTSDALDHLFTFDQCTVEEKYPCYLAQTNETTHEIIKQNLHFSALYSGNIKGVGPRYCPSIEDKVGRYPDRPLHHVFVEPEGGDNTEVYPAGLSTSLPLEVQYAYIRSIKGFENAEITKCGYAIEYDFIQPTNLTHALEAKTVTGLFCAGQINGTTGYEEAAAQGLMAGINAHLSVTRKDPFILSRSESYIGVMIDDLVTLGADEPYRMFTSRAERRLILRQDNVFQRLMPYGHKLGLVSNKLFARCQAEKAIIEKSVALIQQAGKTSTLFRLFNAIEFLGDAQTQAHVALEEALQEKEFPLDALSSRALLGIHAEVRYEGYIEREQEEAEKLVTFQNLEIPDELIFTDMPGLTRELQNKLNKYRPATIAQAQLIQGMTPAALSILIFQSRSKERAAMHMGREA